MFKRIGTFFYLFLVFLCGVLIGEINTYKMLAYRHQMVEHNKIEKQLTPPAAPQRIKKVRPMVRSVV